MKRYLAITLCLVLVLLLWGCEKNITPDQTADTSTGENIVDTSTDENIANTPTGQPLTEDDLRWFNEEFFSQGSFSIRNMFLRCEFDAPENIDLGLLFREGLGEYDKLTQEEMDLYNKAIGYEPYLDYTKITREDMDILFQANTGLLPSQTAKVGLEKLVYLEAYDAYYHCHGDTAYLVCNIESGERASDGTVKLYYRDKYSSPNSLWCVTLKPAGDTYHFVSNLPAE